jgi:hypothetical protein
MPLSGVTTTVKNHGKNSNGFLFLATSRQKKKNNVAESRRKSMLSVSDTTARYICS